MANYPFYRSPFYNNYYNNYNSMNLNNNDTSPVSSSDEITSDKKKSSRYYSFGPVNFKNPLFCNVEEPIFEIFGINLYLDDIIILGLLFFLYREGVKDEMLYISLILLLLN